MNIDKFIVAEDMPLIEAIKVINNNGRGIVFVCINEKLVASISDGDIRRYILKNGDFNSPVKMVANYTLHYLFITDRVNYTEYLEKNSITAIPIVDNNMRILRIEFIALGKVYRKTNLDAPVVIMAGGKGTRLYPFTNILPKPLIPIGDKTITEHIMSQFERFGCTDFNLIVNYKKNLIKAYFEDQDKNINNINFIDETKFLGTGGGLKLLTGKITQTFFMTNCDILVDEDYSAILHYHKKENNILTMVCAMKHIEVPYGIVETSENGQALRLKEKPNYSFMTNTGLYVIEPRFLDNIPPNTFVHITDIIQKYIDQGEKVGIYPISEQAWMDMGNLEELERMKERLI